MQNTNQSKLLPFEAGPEIKAHVYQQLSELEQFSVPTTSMVVLMRKSSPTKRGTSTYAVDLVVSLEEGTLEAEGRARNIYDAVTKAKELMAAQLSVVQNSLMNSREREIQIQTLLRGGSLSLH